MPTDWFTKAELNIRGYGKSRRERFIENGNSLEEMLRHPHFLKYSSVFHTWTIFAKRNHRRFCQNSER